MALNINGRIKVKTLKQQFKDEFWLSIRIYDGRSFANDEATLASIRKGDSKGGEFSPRKNTKVGNLEDKIEEMFGIKTQIAGSDNSYLCDNDLTLAGAFEEDEKKIAKKEKKAALKEKESEVKSDSTDDSLSDTKTIKIPNISEIMLYTVDMDIDDVYSLEDPEELVSFVNNKLSEEATQVYLLDDVAFTNNERTKAIIKTEDQIDINIDYKEEDLLPELEDDKIRVVLWEKLDSSNIEIDLNSNIDTLKMQINGNTFSCLDEWGYSAFTDYNFSNEEKELDVFLESESSGNTVEKIIFFINSQGDMSEIRDPEYNNDIDDDIFEVFDSIVNA